MKQCKKCPWRTDVDPFDIPDGYCPTKHAALADTISEGPRNIGTTLKLMACHESNALGSERPCVGWLHNQLGAGNNIGLRLWAMKNLGGERIEVVGEQHECFEDTLP